MHCSPPKSRAPHLCRRRSSRDTFRAHRSRKSGNVRSQHTAAVSEKIWVRTHGAKATVGFVRLAVRSASGVLPTVGTGDPIAVSGTAPPGGRKTRVSLQQIDELERGCQNPRQVFRQYLSCRYLRSGHNIVDLDWFFQTEAEAIVANVLGQTLEEPET